MPRWRALPEDLDPQIREFASQLRRLVDRSGLSVAAIADRTGYSKSSWERYLNGRLLPPRGATQALAEVTGTDVRHLGTMWELAERAWSRAEMRHDTTLEAISIAQARAALNAPEEEPEKGRRRRKSRSAPAPGRGSEPDSAPRSPGPGLGHGPGHGPGDGDGQDLAPGHGRGYGQDLAPGPGPGHGPGHGCGQARDGGQDQDRETAVLRKDAIRAAGAAGIGVRGGEATAWGGPGAVRAPDATGVHGVRNAPDGASSAPYPAGRPGATGTPRSGEPRRARGGGRRKGTVVLAALVGVLVLVAGAVLFLDLGSGEDGKAAGPKPSPTATSRDLPAGVKCVGDDCSGEDPEAMGCGGRHAATVSSARVGTGLVEVRYSEVCAASWARISGAARDDVLRITAPGGQAESDTVTRTDAYTEMVSVRGADDARACATLAAGGKGCTTPGKTVR